MKTLFTTLFVIIVFFLFQPATAQKISTGVKAGINIATLSNGSSDLRAGFHAGVFADFDLSWSLNLQGEALYSTQGRTLKTNNGTKVLALDYLLIPLMLKYYPVDKLYIVFGPQAGFLINAISKNENDEETEVNSSYEDFDLSLNVGLGYNATKKLFVFSRYNYGLTDITTDTRNLKHRVIQAGVGYRLK